MRFSKEVFPVFPLAFLSLFSLECRRHDGDCVILGPGSLPSDLGRSLVKILFERRFDWLVGIDRRVYCRCVRSFRMNISAVGSIVTRASLCIIKAYLWVSRPLVSHIAVGITLASREIVVTLNS